MSTPTTPPATAPDTPGPVQLSGAAPASTPAPAAAAPATAGKRRGRPPGAADKRPRTRRAGAAAAPKAAKATKPPPPSPLAGAVEGDAEHAATAASVTPGKAGKPKTPKNGVELMSIPSDQIAAMGCQLMNVLVVSNLSKTMKPDEAAQFSLDAEESAEIVRIGTVVLDQYMPKMAPEVALLLTIAIIYANKYGQLALYRSGMTLEQVQARIAAAETQARAVKAGSRAAA